MVSPKVIAPGALNNYVWALLKANIDGLSEVNYKDANAPSGRTPIVPSDMDAALVAINKPFIVYGFSEDPTPDLFARRSGSLSYAVWAVGTTDINQWMNIIRAALERRDESARELNDYTTSLPIFNGIRFADTTISYYESPTPEETEGGRKVGVITIRYQYFMDVDIKRFINGAWQ